MGASFNLLIKPLQAVRGPDSLLMFYGEVETSDGIFTFRFKSISNRKVAIGQIINESE